MNRAVRSVPWLLAAAALAAPVAAPLGVVDPTSVRVLVALLAAAAAVLGTLVHGMPWPFAIAAAVAGVRVATLDGSAHVDAVTSTSPFGIVASITVGVGLLAVLTVAMRSRRGSLDSRDLNDVITVGVGASLTTWIVATSRLIEVDGFGPVAALGRTHLLPIAVLLFAFVVDHLFTGLRSNRAMQFIVLASAANLTAAVVSMLRYAGADQLTRSLELGLYVSALGFLAAGLSHGSAPATLTTQAEEDPQTAYTPLRLALNGTCLLVPGVLVATVAPLSTTDAMVRGIFVAVGISAVMIRLVSAVQSSEQVRHELANRVHRDDLTQLPTRSRFVAIVDEVLEDTWRSEFQPTVVQLNLDRFKDINDSLGHYEANDVLTVVADRLRRATAPFGGSVARLGGDDFAVVDGTTTSTAASMERLGCLRSALAEPVTVGERSLFVTASFGVAIAPRNRTVTADELLRRADIATHAAKMSGRNGVEVFDESMQARLAHRMDVEHALHGAIGRREMQLYHQPIVDIDSGRVSGFESLIRWQRDGNIVSPGEFIPIAEDTGMIVEIGEWALNEALNELAGWVADGVVDPATTISVNVSPRQIADPGFADVVERALTASGVAPQLLWLEVTESMMLDEPELAETTLRDVRDMGVRIALDDFGTGYSSLSMLQHFPIQRIKIDRAFVNGIAEPGHDRTLVRTVIAMAQSMGLDLVAEGVETIHQLRVLAELTCDKAQGFLISHPVPSEAMRSTMVALDALASLSMFDGSGATVDATPASSTSNTGGPHSLPVGATSRPLGQPVL